MCGTSKTYTWTAAKKNKYGYAFRGERLDERHLPVDSNGYYDVIITASTSDGFTRRYAGWVD